MITSVVAGLHSSAVKLTMIRRRSRALTHRTFPILFSVLLLSNFQFLLFRPTSLSLSLSLSLFLSPLLVLLLLSSCSSSSDWREPLPVAYGSLSFFIVFFFHEPAGNRCRVPERAVVDAVKSATCAWPVALLRFRAR